MATVKGKCVKHSRTGQTIRCFRGAGAKGRARKNARTLRMANMKAKKRKSSRRRSSGRRLL